MRGMSGDVVHDALAAASAQLDAGDAAGALAPLLVAWRAYRSDTLAALIEQVSDRAERSLGKVAGDTQKARTAAALALLRTGGPAELPRVMRALADIKVAEAATVIAQLAKVAPDPRFLRELVALLRAPPWGVSTGRGLWRALLAALVTHGDPRTTAQLGAIAWKPIVRDAWAVDEMQKAMARTIKAVRAPAPAVDAAREAAIATLAAAASGAGEDRGPALLARIWAEPEDLAARAVYADWLQAQGDPRGELIALQLAGPAPTEAQRRRAAALIKEHAGAWLGAIAPARLREPGYTRFAGGFVDAMLIDAVRAEPLADAAEWATLRELDLGNQDGPVPHALLRSPALRALRYVGGLAAADLRAIIEARPPWTIRGLGVDPGGLGVRATIARIAELVALPALRELGLAARGHRVDVTAWRPLWQTPLAARLERVRIESLAQDLRAWLAELSRLPRNVQTVQLAEDGGWHGWTLELARGGDGALSRLEARLRPARGGDAEPAKPRHLIEHVLDELPADALEALVVRFDGTRVTQAELAALAAAAGRQARLAELELAGAAVPIGAAKPGARVREVRAAAATSAADAARAAYERAVAAMPAAAQGALRALDFAADASIGPALDALRGSPAAAWAEVAYALLALPDATGEAPRARQHRVREHALRVLVELRPAGAARRVLALIDGPAGRSFVGELRMIPDAELAELFDWFDARRGKAEPRADQIYYAVRAVAGAATSAAVRVDIEARLARPKLGRFQRWAYEHARAALAASPR